MEERTWSRNHTFNGVTRSQRRLSGHSSIDPVLLHNGGDGGLRRQKRRDDCVPSRRCGTGSQGDAKAARQASRSRCRRCRWRRAIHDGKRVMLFGNGCALNRLLGDAASTTTRTVTERETRGSSRGRGSGMFQESAVCSLELARFCKTFAVRDING